VLRDARVDRPGAVLDGEHERLGGGAAPVSSASIEEVPGHHSLFADAAGWFEAASKELALPLGAEQFRAAVERAMPDADHATDLFLATACAERIDGAPEAALRRYGSVIRSTLARMGLDPNVLEEASARTLVIAFVGEGSGPAIGGYQGRGSLAGWFKVTAVRAAHRVLRERRRDTVVEAAAFADSERATVATEDAVWSPQERALLRDEGIEVFRGAVRDALGGLAVEDRTVLRLHYAERLSIDVLAQVWGVHRATAARRVARVRTSIRERVLASLQAEFGSSTTSVGRWVRQMQSRLDGLSSLLESE